MSNSTRPTNWRKSRRSGSGPDSNCVEVAATPHTVVIRDSTLTTGDFPLLSIPAADWESLLASVVE